MTRYGAVEMGGTKTDMTVGTTHEDMDEPHRISTTGPEETLHGIVDYFTSRDVTAIGVACFGPLNLDRSSPDFGTLRSTPKPDWSGVPVHRRLSKALGVPVNIDTDVNGSARGEGRWGAARGMDDFVYVTVGTGIGAGVVVRGEPIAGEHHPEMGHIAVSRHPDDRHPGSCPYHGDCLEGMAAGPALEARFGRPETWSGNDAVIDVAVHYLAQGMIDLVYTVAPERIVVGGGVSKLVGFHQNLRDRVEALLADYPTEPDLDLLIAAPGLGEKSGLAGALVLAASGAR
jgi:fructokinase